MDLVSALIKDRGEVSPTTTSPTTMHAFNSSHFGDLAASQEQQLQQKLRLQHQQQQHHQQQQQQRERLHPEDNSNNSNHQQQQQLHLNQQQQHQQQQQVRTHTHLQQIRQAIQLQQLQNQHSQHPYQQHQQPSPSQQQQQQHYATSSSPLQGTVANMPDSPNTPGSSCAKEEDKTDEWQPYPESAFLGPTLWDKTLPYESQTALKQTTSSRQRPEVKLSEVHDSRGSTSIPSPSPPSSPNPRTFSDAMLEYMDLDDFLDENNLHNGGNNNISNNNSNNSNISKNNNSSIGGHSVESSSTVPSDRSPQQSESPSSPDPTPTMMGTGLGACMGGAMGAQLPPPQNMGLCSPPVMSPNDLMSPMSPGSPPDHSSMINGEYHSEHPHLESEHRGNFDPRTHQFTDDELKPHALVKKSRKQFVPCDLKDDRYWDRRFKNNAAAKRSRDARRCKENQIAMRANFLEKENNALTVEVEQANAIVDALKKRLSVYEAV